MAKKSLPNCHNWPLVEWGEIPEACYHDITVSYWVCPKCKDILAEINCPGGQRFHCDDCRRKRKCRRLLTKQGKITIFTCANDHECRQPLTDEEHRKVFEY